MYLFLCTVGDRAGISFWSRMKMAKLLNLTPANIQRDPDQRAPGRLRQPVHRWPRSACGERSTAKPTARCTRFLTAVNRGGPIWVVLKVFGDSAWYGVLGLWSTIGCH